MTKTIEELQADLEKALGSISRLEAKNSELIDREKAERTRAEAAEKLADEAEANAAAGNELKTLQRDFKKLETALASITDERDTLAGELKTARVDGAISAAIAAGGVMTEWVDAAEAIMHRRVKYENGEATIDGKPIADFAKGYFAKDGYKMVRAADNSGADAQGNTGAKASSHNFTKETYNHSQYAMVYLDDPQLANSIADEVGRPELKASE